MLYSICSFVSLMVSVILGAIRNSIAISALACWFGLLVNFRISSSLFNMAKFLVSLRVPFAMLGRSIMVGVFFLQV